MSSVGKIHPHHAARYVCSVFCRILFLFYLLFYLLPWAVNNAGIGLVGPVESIPIEEMKKVFETNFFGVIRMIKEVMPDMKKRKGGHIIVVSSVMGLQGEQTEVWLDKWRERR